MSETHERNDGAGGTSTIRRSAKWPEDGDLVRPLFADYRRWVADHADPAATSKGRVTEGLALIDRLIAELPRPYQPPHGDILLWFEGESLVACGALRELEPGVGEIRRVYIRSDYRGGEFGRPFTLALIARARDFHFEKVRSDTLPSMRGAVEFHEDLGFHRIPSYWPYPAAGAVFFERAVDSEPRAEPDSETPKSM